MLDDRRAARVAALILAALLATPAGAAEPADRYWPPIVDPATNQYTPGRWVWVPRCGPRSTRTGPGKRRKKREIDPDDEIFWTPGHETSIIQWIPWCSRLSSRWPGK